jgi:Holliday junction resolvasome RuvABC endonuclease subunit
MGIDASTQSLAFCVLNYETPISWGEIDFTGSNVYARLGDAKRKTNALSNEFKCDFVAIESAVMVRSASVAIKLAYVYGAIFGELLESHANVVEVAPISWQSYIGNKNWAATRKADLRKSIPGKSNAWYQNEIRRQRKQFTIDWAKTEFNIDIESNNVSDAFGLAWYASHHLTEQP